jgi:hypothetical protein
LELGSAGFVVRSQVQNVGGVLSGKETTNEDFYLSHGLRGHDTLLGLAGNAGPCRRHRRVRRESGGCTVQSVLKMYKELATPDLFLQGDGAKRR